MEKLSTTLNRVTLCDVKQLFPHEQTEESRVSTVMAWIMTAQRWTSPIIVDQESLCVMDGHHRLAVAKKLALRQVPCMLTSYRDVILTGWRIETVPTREEIVRRAHNGELFPPKTTRHILKSGEVSCDFPLDELR